VRALLSVEGAGPVAGCVEGELAGCAVVCEAGAGRERVAGAGVGVEEIRAFRYVSGVVRVLVEEIVAVLPAGVAVCYVARVVREERDVVVLLERGVCAREGRDGVGGEGEGTIRSERAAAREAGACREGSGREGASIKRTLKVSLV